MHRARLVQGVKHIINILYNQVAGGHDSLNGQSFPTRTSLTRSIRGICALFLLTACNRDDTKSPAAAPPSTSVADTASVDTASAETAWFTRTLIRDLNGDGRADSAVLVARGARPDSSDVKLTLFVDGRETFAEQWSTSYELVDPPASLRTPELKEKFLRGRLGKILEQLRTSPLNLDAIAVTQGIAAIQVRLDSIVPLPKQQLTIAYGFESSIALLWDATRQRFVRFFVCC